MAADLEVVMTAVRMRHPRVRRAPESQEQQQAKRQRTVEPSSLRPSEVKEVVVGMQAPVEPDEKSQDTHEHEREQFEGEDQKVESPIEDQGVEDVEDEQADEGAADDDRLPRVPNDLGAGLGFTLFSDFGISSMIRSSTDQPNLGLEAKTDEPRTIETSTNNRSSTSTDTFSAKSPPKSLGKNGAHVSEGPERDTCLEILWFFACVLAAMLFLFIAFNKYQSMRMTESRILEDLKSSLSAELHRYQKTNIRELATKKNSMIDSLSSSLEATRRKYRENFVDPFKSADPAEHEELLRDLAKNVIEKAPVKRLDKIGNDIDEKLSSLDALMKKYQASAPGADSLDELEKHLTEEIQKLESIVRTRLLEVQEQIKSTEIPASAKRLINLHLQSYSKDMIQERILELLEIYNADRVGVMDYAALMHSKIISHSGGHVGHKASGLLSQLWNLFTMKRRARSRRKSPRVILQPSSNPGDCWTMTGNSGHVSVKLDKLLKVTNVSIQHISDQIAPQYGSTIKEFKIWGRAEALGDKEDYLMGSFNYQRTSNFRIPTIQYATFENSKWLDTVTLEVNSNFGEETYTCIYRLRIHGEADSWGNFPSETFNLTERTVQLSAKETKSFF